MVEREAILVETTLKHEHLSTTDTSLGPRKILIRAFEEKELYTAVISPIPTTSLLLQTLH